MNIELGMSGKPKAGLMALAGGNIETGKKRFGGMQQRVAHVTFQIPEALRERELTAIKGPTLAFLDHRSASQLHSWGERLASFRPSRWISI